MNKEKLISQAQDEKYISGIYNYCDRWCERCPQTSRCLNYHMGEEEFSDPESRDINNEAFWGDLHSQLPGLYGNNIKNILIHLEKFRGIVEKTFSDARKFIRPGFDNIDFNS